MTLTIIHSVEYLRSLYFSATFLIIGTIFASIPIDVFLHRPLIAEAASIPAIMSYQGRLTDSSGNLLGGSGTTYYFKFSIWDSATVGSGNRVWPSSAPSATTASVRQGVFTVNIGDITNGYPDVFDYSFADDTTYLQVEVSSNGSSYETLSPRTQISAAVYSQVSGAVRGSGQSAIGTSTPASTSVLTVEATTSSATALTIRGAPSQSANLFSIFHSTGSSLFSIDASGNMTSLARSLFGFASSTLLSSLDGLYVGRTSTTTILGSATSTFGAGIQTTALNVTSSSATSTFANGLDLSGGCFSINGTCVGGSSSGVWGAITGTLANQTDLQSAFDAKFSLSAWYATTTTALAEGTNQYFTNARADARINATSTIATLTSAPNLGTVSTSLTGFLKATAGVLSAALVDLASNVTGILPVQNGGTGWGNLASGAILLGNGTDAVATTSSGTNGQVLALVSGTPTWVATTTLSNISGTLGIAQGGSGATSFGQGWIYSVGGTNALAASTSPTVNYLTATSTSATSTFAAGISAARLNTSATSTLADVVSQSIIPAADATYDLGSATNRFRDLYLSTASLHLESTAGETGTAKQWKFGIDTGNGTQTGTTTGFFRIQEGNSPMFYLNHAGQLGIGATDPRARLHVVGTDWLSGFSNGSISNSGTTVTGSGTSFLFGYNKVQVGDQIKSNNQIRTVVSVQSNNQLIVDSAFSPALSGEPYQVQQPIVRLDSVSGVTKFIVGPGGNVGIGDLNPIGLLSVGAGDKFYVDAFGNVASGTWNGQKIGVQYGGTGTSTVPTYGKILLGNTTGGYDLVATSTLGLLAGTSDDWTGTFDGQEGSYYLNASNLTNFGAPFFNFFAATTTDALAEGSNNKYYLDSRVQSFVHASSTIPKTYTANTYTNTNTFNGQVNLANASTTNVTVTAVASTSQLVVSNSFTLGTITGFLKATVGSVATAAIDLASDVTGILGVNRGGTGWNNIAAGAVVLGNGTNALATTSAGTNGHVLALVSGTPTWVATTTLSTISGTLGIAKGGTGLTDTPTYGQLLVGNASSGYTLLATSSLGIALGDTTGTLPVNRGGTGATSLSDLVTLGTHSTGNYVATIGGTANQISVSGSGSENAGVALSLPSLLFIANASSTQESVLDGLFVGRTSTTTILGSATSTFGSGVETTALNVTSSSASSTFANGIQLAAGCFRMPDGTCLSNGGGLGLATLNGLVATVQTFATGSSGTDFNIDSSLTTHTFNIPSASASNRGLLTSTDWSTFNSKANTASPTFTGLVALPHASSTALSVLETAYIGRTSTTTIRGDGFASTLPYASTTYITAVTASSSNVVASNTFTFKDVTGFLKATAGAVATSLINLASDVTGILPVANGGTGWGAIQANSLVLGNGTGAVATTTAGVNGQVLTLVSGVPTWVATTTLSNISGTLGATQGGTGLTSITNNQLLIGGAGNTVTQIATSSLGVALSDTTGSLGVSRGGTGATTFASGSLLYGAGTGAMQSVATSSPVAGTAISLSGTGALVGGSGLTINFSAPTDAGLSIPFASTTMVTATSASSTNLWISSLGAGGLLKTNAGGQVAAAVAGTDYASASSVFGKSWEISNGALAPTTTLGLLVSASSTFTGGVTLAAATTTYATTTNLYIGGTITGGGLATCSGSGDKLLWNASTNRFECGSDAGAGGGITGLKGQYSSSQTGSTQTFATSSDANISLTITSSGDTHTFTPAWTGTLAASRGGTGLSSVSAAGVLIGNYAGTGWQQLATSSLNINTDNLVQGSTNLFYADSIVNAYIHASTTIPKTYTANTLTNTNTFSGQTNLTNASTTNVTIATLASTSQLVASNAFTFGSVSGFLKATAGVVATAAIDLANDVTGILGVNRGGTGWGNVAAGAVVLGNGTGALATTSAGTNGQVLALVSGVPTWIATTTLANISGTLGVGNGGTGATSLNDLITLGTHSTGNYVATVAGTANQISVSGSGSENANVTLSLPSLLAISNASSTQSSILDGLFVGRTSTTTILGSATSTFGAGLQTTALNVTSSSASSTFANGIQLAAGCFRMPDGSCVGGGAGATTLDSLTDVDTTGVAYGGLIFYNGSSWVDVATSSLNISTSDLVEGSNLFYTDTRVNSYIHGSTTIPKLYTANAFTAAQTLSGGLTLSGLNGPLDARAGVVGATSSIGVMYGGTGATSLTGLLQGNGTDAFTAIANSSTGGQVLRVTGASTYAWGALDLADSDAITGDLPFGNLTQIAGNSILGNNTGSTGDVAAIATSSLYLGTNGQVLARVNGAWVGVATTTAGTGLSYSGGAFNVNTSQNIATLSSLTSNGFVKTSGGTGALSIDTSTYLTDITGSSIKALSDVAAMTENYGDLLGWNGTSWTDFATSSLSIALSDTTGTLAVNRGGTGATSLTDLITLGTHSTGNYVATLADAGGGTLTIANSGSENAGVTAALNLGNANTWTGKQNLYGTASSTLFSAHEAFFGSTATATISSAGVLTLPTALAVSSGGSGAATLTGILKGNGTSAFTAAVAGTDYLTDNFREWRVVNGTLAPTTTLGIIVSASSTVGSGAQAGGLSISGGATTTGFLVVQGNATSTFSAGLQTTALNVTSSSASSTFANGIQLAAGCFRMPDGSCVGGGAGASNLDSLTDVTISGALLGEFLSYNGSAWVDTATSTLFSNSSQLSTWLSDETGSGSFVLGTSPTFTTSINLGAAGVRLSDDGDGSLTFLGIGDGSGDNDEDLTFNFEDTADQVVVTSSTGVATTSFLGIGVSAARLNTSATSTFAGVRIASGGLTISTLDCSGFTNGGNLTTDSSGNVMCAADDGGGGGSLQGSYDGGATIETAAATPMVITETTAAANTHDLLQLTANAATGGTFAGDALQIMMDSVDANANTGNGLHVIVDQSQTTGFPVLIEDDTGVDLFAVAESGGVTIGSTGARADVDVYGTMTNKGYKKALGISGIIDIFVYDTTKDSDAGRWRLSSNSDFQSWYTEAKDDSVGDLCVPASDDRCGSSAFPAKAILVTTADSLYIFDANTNTMWMKFSQNASGYALGVDTNNNPSGVGALNGTIYVGANGASGAGLYAFDFKTDRMYNYDSTDRSQGDKNIANRNTAVAYATDNQTSFAIANNVVNDVHVQILSQSGQMVANTSTVSGKTFVAVATDASASVISIDGARTIDYADNATDDVNQVWLTSRGRLYLTNETLSQVELYTAVDADTVDQITPDDIYDEATGNQPNLAKTAPTFSTSPDALFVLERESIADGQSQLALMVTTAQPGGDVLYVGHSLGLSELHTVGNPLTSTLGWSKFYTITGQTSYMNGTPRAMFMMNDASGDITDATIRNNVLDVKGSPTYRVNGVHDFGMSFNGTSQYACSDANNDGTCDTDADFDPGLLGFTIELWFRHDVGTAGIDTLIDHSFTTVPAAAPGYRVWMDASGLIQARIDDDTTFGDEDPLASPAGKSYADGQWHHLVFTRVSTAFAAPNPPMAVGIYLFIDGVMVSSDNTIAATGTLNGSAILAIGADCSVGAACATGANFWDGDIDDVYISMNGVTFSDSLNASSGAVARKYSEGRAAMLRPSTQITDATTVSANTIGDSGAAYVVNEFVGEIVEITGGTGVGQTRKIVSNTATTFTVTPNWTVTPDTTSDYEVVPEQLYGSTNSVTSIGVTDSDPMNTSRTLYVGTSNGTDGGGVSVFSGYGTPKIIDVYHADAGVTDDAGTAWTGTDSDDMGAIEARSGIVVLGSLGNLWTRREDRVLEQSIDQLINNVAQVRMEMQADGLQAGALNGGAGADLAENYHSNELLQAGDIVAIDPDISLGVRKTTSAYQRDALGVVATMPGIVLGPGTDITYPVALVGRVPVKITTENGVPKVGDRITASSIPGYGMRATKAGRVLGATLEAVDMEQLALCPGDEETATRRCGQVMVFVNLVDYGGVSLSVLMNEKKEIALADGLAQETHETVDSQTTARSYLAVCDTLNVDDATTTDMADEFATTTPETSESEPCVPGNEFASATSSIATSTSASSTPVLADRDLDILEFLRDYKASIDTNSSLDSEIFTDRLNAGIELFSPRIVANGLRVETIDALAEQIRINPDILFFGRPYFTSDTAGFALIKKGDSEVTISFDREYLEKPIVNASLSSSDGVEATAQSAAAIQVLLGNDIRFLIGNASPTGFTIYLNKPAEEDFSFNWIALAVKGARTSESSGLTIDTVPEVVEIGSASSTNEALPEPKPEREAASEENTPSDEKAPSDAPVEESEDTPPPENVPSDESQGTTSPPIIEPQPEQEQEQEPATEPAPEPVAVPATEQPAEQAVEAEPTPEPEPSPEPEPATEPPPKSPLTD